MNDKYVFDISTSKTRSEDRNRKKGYDRGTQTVILFRTK